MPEIKLPKRHPFTFTLGPGPYLWVGSFNLGQVLACMEANPAAYENGMREFSRLHLDGGGGSCAHCGRGILDIQIIRTGEGKHYGVGSDCVLKLNAEGTVENISKMEREIRDKAREQRRRREEEKVKELMPDYTAALVKLETVPHPHPHFASQGKSLADYYRYCSKTSANMRAAIKSAAAQPKTSFL